MHLNKIFSVQDQFQRSINIEADFDNQSTLENFIITPLTIDVLTRLLTGLGNQSSQNAWTITGPYGAGKSASLLFIAQLLGKKNANKLQLKLHKFAPDLERKLMGGNPDWPNKTSLVIPLIGTRESVAVTLLRGIIKAFSSLDTGILSEETSAFKVMLSSYYSGKPINEVDLLDAFSKSLVKIIDIEKIHSNVIIVFDELGKSLEFASQVTSKNDIGVLQLFAELANRSHGQFSLITVLHQAFERYADVLNPIQRQEWSKVQGRFENIGFLESNAEILNLLQQAICRNAYKRELLTLEREFIDEMTALNILPPDLSTKVGLKIIAGCLPLHPTTALLLYRLFRSFFAQNERSLFAFLSSNEPNGFQAFLKSISWEPNERLELYRLNNLFDYLASSFGNNLHTLGTGNKWVEIYDALERLPSDASSLEINLIKSIGLLELFGDQQFTKASLDFLAFSLGSSTSEVKNALNRLLELRIVVFREFKLAYGFWQGSDVDLAVEYTSAFAKIDRSSKLSVYIQNLRRINPSVSRKHQFATGTLRYFKPIVMDINDLERTHDLFSENIDGGLLIVVMNNGNTDKTEVIEKVKSFSNKLDHELKKRSLFQIPGDLQGLREAYEEVLTWQYVKNNTPALENDRIARRELALYEHNAIQRLDALLVKYFDLALAFNASDWIHGGEQLFFENSRVLRAKLAEILDNVFSKAPIIPNELINHSVISSAAAGARNALLEKMIDFHHQENLGITGFPPEMSIYLSILRQSGLHHVEDGTWKLGPDPKHDTLRIKPLWEDVYSFLLANSSKPIEVPRLFQFLRSSPYGLKEGVLSIYLIVALIQWQAQIAIYEENTYIPKLTSAVCERLLKVPERFKIQLFPESDSHALLLHKYVGLFHPEIDKSSVSLLSAVQPLMFFVNKLPKYAFLTSQVSQNTKRMRDVIVTAKNPQSLLLKDLPDAFSFSFTNADAQTSSLENYFEQLTFSILELETCYDKLLNRIKAEICQTLMLSDDLSLARNEISLQGKLVSDWINDLSLKSFLLRLSDAALNDRQWLESIAALLTNKPPRNWDDQDEVSFKLQLRAYARKLRNIEDIILDEGKLGFVTNNGAQPMRIGIMDADGDELSSVLHVSASERLRADSIAQEINAVLAEQNENTKLKVVALTNLIKELISEGKENQTSHDH